MGAITHSARILDIALDSDHVIADERVLFPPSGSIITTSRRYTWHSECRSFSRTISTGHADETVSFALDGAEYEIDLSAKNASNLRDAVSPWLGHARKTGGRRKRGTAAKVPARPSSTSDIRAWAQANGHEVSSRGRVSAEVREAYEQAHA